MVKIVKKSSKTKKKTYDQWGPQGKSIIALFREYGNWMEKLRYSVNEQSGIQRDWVNMA